MSAENGKMHVTASTPPTAAVITAAKKNSNISNGASAASVATMMMTAAKIKREPGSMLLSNGSALTKLTSFAPARDLTLGGRGALGGGGGGGANKKVFTPNLNVVRNKNANVKTSKDTTARGRGGRGRGERGGRGAVAGRGMRGGANSAFIQTAGVFSEGAGAINIRKSSAGGGGGFRSSTAAADDAPSAMRKPMIIKREHQRIDVQAEAVQVRELLGASDDDDFVDEKTDLEQIPIKLNEAKWKSVKVEKPAIKVESQNGFDDNNEDSTASDVNSATIQKIQQTVLQRNVGSFSRYPLSVDELLAATQPQIFLMQLPDTLPCEDEPTDSPEKPSTSDGKETAGVTDATTPSEPAKKSSSSSLKNMEEGQVGKLLRYKSGKVKLILGESHFDLDMGMETGFLQDLMSINTNREERSGNMINLGTIQAKLTATPDWEYMLKQQMSLDKP